MGAVTANRLLVVALGVAAGGLSCWALAQLIAFYPFSVDLEIPLRAAERWMRGEPPYVASAFEVRGGPDLPFLYPPFVLPIYAALSFLPRLVLQWAWFAICVAAGAFVGRRFGVAPGFAVLVLIWPPFAEAILGGNVQVVLTAAFVALFWRGGKPLDPADPGRLALVVGGLASVIAAIKVSQFVAWVHVLRWRPRAALLGLALAAALSALLLPIVGPETWLDWLGQAGRASDPGWSAIGAPLSTYVGRPLGLAITAATAVIALVLPRRHAGAWLGILLIVGAPSLHMFQLLFLLPAMLLVRREITFIAAMLVATYLSHAIWIAVAMVGWSLAASARWPALAHRGPMGGLIESRSAASESA
jgi:hypothetical protein